MASLHYFPSSSTPSFHSLHPSSPAGPFFAKPSYLITHAKRNSRIQISCAAPSGAQNEKDQSTSINGRRSMVLGLGGAAATSLVFSPWAASASPLEAPDFSKCIGDDCCPPKLSQDIINYRRQLNFSRRVRKPAHKLSESEIAQFNLAIYRMKHVLPKDDPRSFEQQAKIHCAYCSGTHGHDIHGSWLFFPFHRWYLYFFERILGKLVGDPEFGLPYWNWDHPDGMTVPDMFLNTNSYLYHSNREAHLRPAPLVDLMSGSYTKITDCQQLKKNNLAIISKEMESSNVYDFMGLIHGPGTSERSSHTTVHTWVGGDMNNIPRAANDPLFYSHHANVDRMWSLWSRNVSKEQISDRDFLDSAFLFYDENKRLVRVTVKDCLDPFYLGYGSMTTETPWLNYKPPQPQPHVNRRPAPRLRTLTTEQIYRANLKTDNVFPLKLNRTVKLLQVPKVRKGKANEELVIGEVTVDTTKFVKFDVFVNDQDDDDLSNVNKASYLGTYSHLPHGKTANTGTQTAASVSFKLTRLYDELNVGDDDDSIALTLVPRHQGDGVTIGSIRILPV